MGTRIELHLFGAGADDALWQAQRAIESVDDALTIHRPSPVTAMNEALRAGQSAPIDDPLLLEALRLVHDLHGATGGLFDPSAGAGRWDSIEVDFDAARIAAAEPVALDFGGFGKGYALDLACAALRGGGAVSAFLSAGESSIAVVGRHPLGVRWPVGVPHPLNPAAFLVELDLADEAVSISSTLATAPGRSVTIRPATGEVVEDSRTAIAVDASGASAEAMSTALLVADGDHGARLIGLPGRRFAFSFVGERAISLITREDFASHG